MREPLRTLLESIVVLLAAGAVALCANALSPEGRPLTAPLPPPPADRAAATPGADPVAAVRERLAALGAGVIPHDQVVQLHADELYAYEAYVFVDARNGDLYERGHIPGAWSFDPYHAERDLPGVKDVLQTAQQVVVYCYGQDCTDSELAVQHLVNHRLVDPAVLNVYVGGMKEWCASGRQVERGERGSGELVECPE